MIREKVDVKDFNKIAKEHKHFIWHFLLKKQSKTTLGLFSFFEERNEIGVPNPLGFFLKNLDIPYFESYTEDSIDFLIDCGISAKLLYVPKYHPSHYYPRREMYNPVILGFNHYSKVSSTFNPGYCYCIEGLTNIVMDLDPSYILNLELN